ncbi:MAG: 16S rRNA (cytidine(1402)-2'-O)-methyltransferase [Bdellovibrionales bacterium]
MVRSDEQIEQKTWPDFALWGKHCLQENAIEKKDASKVLGLNSGLYIVATPIGNLGDITLRALWTLQEADLILCEDTRVSGKLLNSFGLKKPLLSCHEHNEEAREQEVLSRLAKGESLALISDAGMPLIADPGYRLVRACREAGFMVTIIPGANAALTALAGSGLPTNSFLSSGFLPHKSGARQKELEALSHNAACLVFYESPHRLMASLKDMSDCFGKERRAVVARELTKRYETFHEGCLADLCNYFETTGAPKGEMVLVVAPEDAPAEDESWEEVLENCLKTMSLRDAVVETVEATGISKKTVYQKALELIDSGPSK